MDDADVLEAVRDCDPATAKRIADRLSISPETVHERLATLEEDGRIERADDGDGDDGRWTVTRDPRIDESVDRMTDRLGRERRR
ncbi:winged helix-turn-helix domain-containing protein [Halalkalicoccus ordinarius]|uniref:winged helix-turn-helix domain-containing protein n=1 Tax=Halalkalicoccus ordinarius TaxID=3116651 RepID=UPI00300F1214